MVQSSSFNDNIHHSTSCESKRLSFARRSLSRLRNMLTHHHHHHQNHQIKPNSSHPNSPKVSPNTRRAIRRRSVSESAFQTTTALTSNHSSSPPSYNRNLLSVDLPSTQRRSSLRVDEAANPSCYSSDEFRPDSSSCFVSTVGSITSNQSASSSPTQITNTTTSKFHFFRTNSLISSPSTSGSNTDQKSGVRKITFHNLLQFNKPKPTSTSTCSSAPALQSQSIRRCASFTVNPRCSSAWNSYKDSLPKSLTSISHRRVILAVDSSEDSERAFRWYLDYMMEANDRILLIHIAEPMLQVASGFAPLRYWDSERDCAHHLRGAYVLLQRYLERAAAQNARGQCEAHIYTSRHPSIALVQASKKHKADVIVMGSRGDGREKGGFKGFFLGSVARNVLKNIDIPVTLVPPYHVDPLDCEMAQRFRLRPTARK